MSPIGSISPLESIYWLSHQGDWQSELSSDVQRTHVHRHWPVPGLLLPVQDQRDLPSPVEESVCDHQENRTVQLPRTANAGPEKCHHF